MVQKPVLSAIDTPAVANEGDAGVDSGRDRARREADAARPGLLLLDAGNDATVAGRWHHRPVEGDVVPDQRSLRLDHPFGAAVADCEQPAELVDDFVGIESDRFRVVANEGAGEDPGGPARKVIALEAIPQIRAHFGDRGNGLQRNAAALTLAAQPGSEGLPV